MANHTQRPPTLHHHLKHASLLRLHVGAICCKLLLLVQLLSHLLEGSDLSLQGRQLQHKCSPPQQRTGIAG